VHTDSVLIDSRVYVCKTNSQIIIARPSGLLDYRPAAAADAYCCRILEQVLGIRSHKSPRFWPASLTRQNETKLAVCSQFYFSFPIYSHERAILSLSLSLSLSLLQIPLIGNTCRRVFIALICIPPTTTKTTTIRGPT
jgi:hypothetical protein